MDKDRPLTYDKWVQGLLNGRSYVGDGASHIEYFKINDCRLGEKGNSGKVSELSLASPTEVVVSTKVNAWLPESQSEQGAAIQQRRLDEKPYWHIERARKDKSREVKVELVVNGEVQQSQSITADGNWREISWNVDIEESSWVAVRIFPTLHTNPIFVSVDNKPVRANAKSAKWCREAVDVCWNRKKTQIRPTELDEASKAYQRAREFYDLVLKECSEKP
jgi:hypothetical protein